MTDKEILKKAIEKAEKNTDEKFYYFTHDKAKGIFWSQLGEKLIKSNNHWKVIFSHDFAKAFWGEKGLIKSIIEYDLEVPWIKVIDKELGIYYRDANHKKFLKEKSSAHMIFKKDGKYVCKMSNPYGFHFEEIELGTWEEYPIASDYGYWCSGWEFHLREMVLEKEPLKYLEKFL